MNGHEPRIIAFFCNFCSYLAADMAGVSRIQYPPNVRIIRLMCTGRLSPLYILEAFARGADGVLVAGCHPGDCHFIKGNLYARRRVSMLKKLLEMMGIDPRRLRLEWVSASEGNKLANVIKEFVEEVRSLGANPLKEVNA